MNRSDFLKGLGLTALGSTFLGRQLSASTPSDVTLMPKDGESYDKFPSPDFNLEARVSRPMTAIVIGAGGRGNAYANYSQRYPKALSIVGVSDINEGRKLAMAQKFNIPDKNQFGDFSEVFKVSKIADAVIISTPDDLHYEPCLLALEKGYHVLLEKPIAPTEEECLQILAHSKKHNKMVAVCHVLRYAPYFLALKKAVETKMIGEIVSVQHTEPIQFEHMAHSYVRGNWHNSKETTPIILAKSCHDLDILRWLVGKPCKSISADGSLSFFRKENAPVGATARCTDGCPVELQCPYSAINIYVRKKKMLRVFDLPKNEDQLILDKLKTTNYGRCVFLSNNDQCDHYVVNMVFEGGITAGFNMEALTSYSGRRTRIMGTRGDIVGDMSQFVLTDFLTGRKTIWDQKINEIDGYKGVGHGGGDWGLVKNFVEAVISGNESLLSSTIDASVESHLMGFKAEESRLSMSKVAL